MRQPWQKWHRHKWSKWVDTAFWKIDGGGRGSLAEQTRTCSVCNMKQTREP